MHCPAVTVNKGDNDRRLAVDLPCNRWSCELCSPRRRLQLIAEACRGLPDTLLTLTTRRERAKTPERAALDMSHAWRNLTKRIVREATRNPVRNPDPGGPTPRDPYPRDNHGRVPNRVRLADSTLAYFAVFEKHKSGWPHLHVLLRSEWIDHNWLQAQWMDLTGSPGRHIKRIADPHRAASYVAKYLSKDPTKFGTAKRYWQTRNWQVVQREQAPLVIDAPGLWARTDETLRGWIAARRSEAMHAWLVHERKAFAVRPS